MAKKTAPPATKRRSSAAGRELGRVMRHQGQPKVGLTFPEARRDVAPAPRADVSDIERSMDFGLQDNIPREASPLLQRAQASAQSNASMRQRMTAPRPGRPSQAVPYDELETQPPVGLLKGRLPLPRFPGSVGHVEETEDVDEGTARAYEQMLAKPERSTHYDPRVAIRKHQDEDSIQPRVRQSRNNGVVLRGLAEEDVDQVWDWLRTEQDRAEKFFGTYIKTALQLHTHMGDLMQREDNGTALLRAIDVDREFVGLAVAWPISVNDNIAHLHLYISPELRNQMATILPPLIEEAERVVPAPLRLSIFSDRMGWDRLLEPLGFIAHTVLIKER